MTRRETTAERNQRNAEIERRAWESFRPKLDALQSYSDAKQLISNAPQRDSPGRGHYMNLGIFLQDFTVPLGSSYTEKSLYLQFVQRLGASGSLKIEVQQKVEADLRRAMEAQGF